MNRSILLSLTLAAGFALPLAAQGQTLRFCFTNGAVTNVDSTGQPSRIGVRIGGYPTVFITPTAGDGPTELAQRLATELQNRGFTFQLEAGGCVCVSGGPGGAALTHGGGIGSTDTGVTGIRSQIVKKPFVPPPPPPVKNNGVKVPKAKPQVVAPHPGQIQIDVEVEKTVNGQRVLITVQLVVHVDQNDTKQQIDQKIRQAIETAGLKPKSVSVPDPLGPQNFHEAFCIDRDVDGDPVKGVTCSDPQGLGVLDFGVSAGDDAALGTTDFGQGFLPGMNPDDLAWIDGGWYPGLGFPYPITIDSGLPNAPGGLFVSPFEQPLPLLFLDPLAWAYPDLGASVFLPGMCDPLGAMQFALPIPPDPALSGLELFMQGVVVDPVAPALHLTQGLRVVPGN